MINMNETITDVDGEYCTGNYVITVDNPTAIVASGMDPEDIVDRDDEMISVIQWHDMKKERPCRDGHYFVVDKGCEIDICFFACNQFHHTGYNVDYWAEIPVARCAM